MGIGETLGESGREIWGIKANNERAFGCFMLKGCYEELMANKYEKILAQ